MRPKIHNSLSTVNVCDSRHFGGKEMTRKSSIQSVGAQFLGGGARE